MENRILAILAESLAVKDRSVKENLDKLESGAQRLAECLASDRKVLIFGNGGSAADAQHIAAEFVNRFAIERPPLAAIALTTDTSILTSIGNDYHFDDIFSKQIHALGKKGDVAWAISTSGNSANVLKGIEAAGEKKMATVAMTGRGGRLAAMADLSLTVSSDSTARIQETHLIMAHILCDLVERILFPKHFKK
ncbi:MAG: D-sedoheptulose 7-phosphate isomerase [Desulfobacterales bacterium]|jgi:D-sedoheptulose 7-phosphate isomerase|nr:D-sedoheptulose 7-phosphate isomerase [Desulfobacterales bacterium]